MPPDLPQAADLAGCAVVFDLDGTLVDSAPDLHRALNSVLDDLSLPNVALSQVRHHVGQGARRLIARVSEAQGVNLSEERLDDLTERYVQTYAADVASLTTIFPGVVPVLQWLTASGARLSVCTNKRTSLSRQLLGALNLSQHFEDIVGADAVENRKPHGDHFLAALEATGGNVSASLMIGDSLPDVETARAAGAPVAVVDFGYTDTAPALLGADAVFSHYSELPAIAVRLLGRA